MGWFDDIRGVREFQALPRASRNLVFYSEGSAYWPHMRRIIEETTTKFEQPLIYLSSNTDDPGMHFHSPLIKQYFIGDGGARTNLFRNLDAGVLVMTMPDLNSFYIKKSPGCRHYAYLFHSPVSTHMTYQSEAFDSYDSIFCVGPHHEQEIRAREKDAKLPAKQLIRHGCSWLDELILNRDEETNSQLAQEFPHVLVAPTWDQSGMVETLGAELIGVLLDAGFFVTLRPHPQTTKLSSGAVKKINKLYASNSRFQLETDMSKRDSLTQALVLISDWSGIAYDFAFSQLRPVIFIDTPKKVLNPEFQKLGHTPLEVFVREQIGKVVQPTSLNQLPSIVRESSKHQATWRNQILQVRNRWIFNVGTSAKVAAEQLVYLANTYNTPSQSAG